MVQLTPNDRHYSESTWPIGYDSAYNNRVFNRCQNTISFTGCMGLGLLPLFMKLLVDYLQEKKIPLVPENKLLSIKNGVRHGTRRVSVGKQTTSLRISNSDLAGICWKYLKYRSCSNLPLAPTNPGSPYVSRNPVFLSYQRSSHHHLRTRMPIDINDDQL